MTHPTSNQHARGFTIVETLVAITVLMIAIAGPLVVANKGLVGATSSKNQLIAAYLASESIEAVKNIRDNNLAAGSPWLQGIGQVGSISCAMTSPCDASALGGVRTCAAQGCPIYKDTTFGYVHSGAVTTQFARFYYIHNPNGTGFCVRTDECAVTAEVDWNEGITSYKVTQTSELTSTLR